MSKERLQRAYSNMKTRCYNPNSNRYHCYGGRGIKVCDEWLGWGKGFKNFEKWALLNGYADNLTIDRIDVNGNYEPNNCRWVTNKQNTNNTRRNRNITYNGETHTMSEWCEILGVKLQTLSARIYRGWSLEDVMTRPIRKQTRQPNQAVKWGEVEMEEMTTEQYLKKYYNFTDEQCKMHDLLTQLWHLTYLSNKQFAQVLSKILNEVENV